MPLDQNRFGEVDTRTIFPREEASWEAISTSEKVIIPQAIPVVTIFPAPIYRNQPMRCEGAAGFFVLPTMPAKAGNHRRPLVGSRRREGTLPLCDVGPPAGQGWIALTALGGLFLLTVAFGVLYFRSRLQLQRLLSTRAHNPPANP